MTKKAHSLAFAALLLTAGAASARPETFNCVRDLLPITGQAAFQVKRKGVERPFAVSQKYLIFPEVNREQVTGFYVYSGEKAWYYDGLAGGQPLTSLKEAGDTVYELVAQPDGLETISIQFLPGFRSGESVTEGPAILGSTILPVVGAVMSRDNLNIKSAYHNPANVGENDLKKWIYQHASRKPASLSAVTVKRKMIHLENLTPKSAEELREPLVAELSARKQWVREHNLDEDSFRKFARLMDRDCSH